MFAQMRVPNVVAPLPVTMPMGGGAMSAGAPMTPPTPPMVYQVQPLQQLQGQQSVPMTSLAEMCRAVPVSASTMPSSVGSLQFSASSAVPLQSFVTPSPTPTQPLHHLPYHHQTSTPFQSPSSDLANALSSPFFAPSESSASVSSAASVLGSPFHTPLMGLPGAAVGHGSPFLAPSMGGGDVLKQFMSVPVNVELAAAAGMGMGGAMGGLAMGMGGMVGGGDSGEDGEEEVDEEEEEEDEFKEDQQDQESTLDENMDMANTPSTGPLPPINLSKSSTSQETHCHFCNDVIGILIFYPDASSSSSSSSSSHPIQVACNACVDKQMHLRLPGVVLGASGSDGDGEEGTGAGGERDLSFRKRRVKGLRGSQRVYCEACNRRMGFVGSMGGAGIEGSSVGASAGGGGVGASGVEGRMNVEPICARCVRGYDLCTQCGGGGTFRTGKWRPRQLFEPGRRTCSLSHDRIGAISHFQITSYACPSSPIESPQGTLIDPSFDPRPSISHPNPTIQAFLSDTSSSIYRIPRGRKGSAKSLSAFARFSSVDALNASGVECLRKRRDQFLMMNEVRLMAYWATPAFMASYEGLVGDWRRLERYKERWNGRLNEFMVGAFSAGASRTGRRSGEGGSAVAVGKRRRGGSSGHGGEVGGRGNSNKRRRDGKGGLSGLDGGYGAFNENSSIQTMTSITPFPNATNPTPHQHPTSPTKRYVVVADCLRCGRKFKTKKRGEVEEFDLLLVGYFFFEWNPSARTIHLSQMYYDGKDSLLGASDEDTPLPFIFKSLLERVEEERRREGWLVEPEHVWVSMPRAAMAERNRMAVHVERLGFLDLERYAERFGFGVGELREVFGRGHRGVGWMDGELVGEDGLMTTLAIRWGELKRRSG
ncbi:hypothetical protein HDU97_004198 [Phlyctochytrium planicorne]|nr:hypothetical protein HDU97_004198 [Phlyctochytrium planicorne]